MLDENLPTFYIRPSNDKPTHQSTLYLLKGGNEAKPAYTLRHLEPSAPASKNRYAVALSDSYVPDILYGETLLIPKWTQPNLSQEAIRANGGVPPPPEPILPTEFTIQLYNPDQQIIVRHKPGSWNTPMSWEFEMPQQTFRQPSSSALDRTMSDPAASDTTPKLRFNWRKDGRLSKDLGCYLSGKTTNPDGTNKKNKEPDITIAIFKGLKEITLYEPNLYRVEMEDFKGLEVVLMLGAVIIRDVYFGNMKECFHISDPPKAGSPVEGPTPPVDGKQPKANGKPLANQVPQQPNPHAQQQQQSAKQRQQQQQQQQQGAKPPVNQQPRPPPTDPRTQWEIDEESRRLKQQSEVQSRERRRREKEQEKRTKRMLEAEQKEARRRQAQLDKETELLKKKYGKEDKAYWKNQQGTKPPQQQPQPNPRPHPQPPLPQRPQSARPPPQPQPQPKPQQPNQGHHHFPFPFSRPSTNPPPRQPAPHAPIPHGRFASHSGPVPVIHGPSSHRPTATQPSAHLPQLRPPGPSPQQQQPPNLRDRRSILGLFRRDEEQNNTLMKKKSSIF